MHEIEFADTPHFRVRKVDERENYHPCGTYRNPGVDKPGYWAEVEGCLGTGNTLVEACQKAWDASRRKHKRGRTRWRSQVENDGHKLLDYFLQEMEWDWRCVNPNEPFRPEPLDVFMYALAYRTGTRVKRSWIRSYVGKTETNQKEKEK